MNFYVPLLLGCEGRFLWNLIRSDLLCRYRCTTGRRIQALHWEGDASDDRSVIVGEPLPGGAEDDPVMVIHESFFLPGSMMFVCTLGMLLANEVPVALALTEHWRVVEFDDG